MILGKVRHDEAWVLSFWIDLRLADDLTGAAPTLGRMIFELAEVGAPTTAHAGIGLGPEHCRIEMAQESGVLRHASDVKHFVELAPGEDRLAGEAAVVPQDDANVGEAFADKSNDDLKCFDGAIAGITVARAQLRPHRPGTDEAIGRQVAVGVIVAVEEPAFLIAVDETVGGIEVEHDLFRVGLETRDGLTHQKPLDGGMIGGDLVDAEGRSLAGFGVGQFEAVEGGLARQGASPVDAGTFKTERIGLARAEGHHRIAAEGVLVVEILVAHRHAEDALAQQIRDRVLDEGLAAMVGEAIGELIDQTGAQIDLPQEEDAAVGTDVATLEIDLNFAATEVLKSEGLLDTVRHAAAGVLCVRYYSNTNTLH